MNLRASRFKKWVFLLILLATTAVLAYNKIEFFIITAPKTPLYGVQRIAVLNFTGEEGFGAEFSDHLIRSVMTHGNFQASTYRTYITLQADSVNLREEPIKLFDLIEREQLYQVVKEQGLENTSTIEDANALEIARDLAVDAIIVGSFDYVYNTTNSREKREITNKKGVVTKTYYEDCTEVNFHANVTARVIRVENGEIIKNFTPKYEYKKGYCGSSRSSLLSREQLVQNALTTMSSQIAASFVPGYQGYKIELDKVKEKKFRDQADKAAKLADDYQFDEAFTIYNELYQQDSYNPKLAFNLGLLHEIHGNFEQAAELYEIALQIKSKEKKYQEAVSRIEWHQEQAEKLAEFGFEIQLHEFNVVKEALAEKVKVKGKDSERVKVFSEPSQSSKVIAKVPGGVELVVLAVEGDWYKLKLLGNKEGYLQKKEVDR